MLGKTSQTKRRRKHGYLQRKGQGGAVLKSRRSKGRKRLTYKKHEK